jgi:hypothetical protein
MINVSSRIDEIRFKIKEFFKDIQFDEKQHRYTYEGKQLTSVSHIVESFIEPVDFDEKAGFVALKEGKTKEEVLAEWKKINKDSIIKGKKTHNFAEVMDTLLPSTEEEKQVVKFWTDLQEEYPFRYIILWKECRMVHKVNYYSGTCDIILYDTLEDKIVIPDYKTNKDIFKCFKEKKLLNPFELMLDNPFNHYQIQLSLYDRLFSQIGIQVSERWLIWIKKDSYSLFKTKDLKSELDKWMEDKTFILN